VRGDAFTVARDLAAAGARFDLVVVDRRRSCGAEASSGAAWAATATSTSRRFGCSSRAACC